MAMTSASSSPSTRATTAATASAISKVSSLLLVESNVDVLVKGKGVEWIMRAMQAAQQAHADGDANAHTTSILTSGARALQRLCVDEQKHLCPHAAGRCEGAV